MKIRLIITVIILISSIPISASDGILNGTYEKIDSDSYEINVYLPSSHFNVEVVETNYSIENSMITNVVNFLVNQYELQLLKESFTISGDSEVEYKVYLEQKYSGTNQELSDIEFLISFVSGTAFLIILYKILTRKFKEINNPYLRELIEDDLLFLDIPLSV